MSDDQICSEQRRSSGTINGGGEESIAADACHDARRMPGTAAAAALHTSGTRDCGTPSRASGAAVSAADTAQQRVASVACAIEHDVRQHASALAAATTAAGRQIVELDAAIIVITAKIAP
jgi:hypothetical protein